MTGFRTAPKEGLARRRRKAVDGMVAGHARIARRLADALRLPDATLDALGSSYETWNGKGFPGERSGVDRLSA